MLTEQALLRRIVSCTVSAKRKVGNVLVHTSKSTIKILPQRVFLYYQSVLQKMLYFVLSRKPVKTNSLKTTVTGDVYCCNLLLNSYSGSCSRTDQVPVSPIADQTELQELSMLSRGLDADGSLQIGEGSRHVSCLDKLQEQAWKNCKKQNLCLPNTVIVKTRHPFNKE
ncbi:chemokine-like protein TAFA-1 isoform 1-T2 [Theristicus caerulescens]